MELDANELVEARETLRQLEERLRRDVRDMAGVLRADVPTFLGRSVKAAFEESAAADALDDAAVKRLKEDTARTSRAVADDVGKTLERFELWTWDRADPPPRDARGLDANPEIAAVLRRVGEALGDLLERHGLGRNTLGDRGAYRLPTYFVAGHFMKSLVESYWQTLTMHHELRQRIETSTQSDQRKRRRDRWDKA